MLDDIDGSTSTTNDTSNVFSSVTKDTSVTQLGLSSIFDQGCKKNGQYEHTSSKRMEAE